jgi:hypothetical protein
MGWAGGTATQGVHSLDGLTAFTAPGRNSTPWTAANEVPGLCQTVLYGTI